jgi:hypothetical protein
MIQVERQCRHSERAVILRFVHGTTSESGASRTRGCPQSFYPVGRGWNSFEFRPESPEFSHLFELLFLKSKSFCRSHCINTRKPLALSVARGRVYILIHLSLSCSRSFPYHTSKHSSIGLYNRSSTYRQAIISAQCILYNIMARSRGPLIWTTYLLYTLCLVTVALGKNLGSPGNRPRSANGTASSNGTTLQNVTPEGGACSAQGIKPSTFNRTLHSRALSFNDLVAEVYSNICLQAAFETQVPQSMWTYDQLAMYGWVVANRNSDAVNVFYNLPMSAVTKP